jgi:hypothetical protein
LLHQKQARANASNFLYPRCARLYFTYHFKTEMMIFRQTNGLKGQFILAQGKRSVALGLKMDVKIVRGITFFERLSLLRTMRFVSHFRPKEDFGLDYCFRADGFPIITFTPDVVWG